MSISEYECFSMFMSLKMHFTSKYDYFKYNGKIKISKQSYEKRKDRFFFVKLSRTFTQKNDLQNFLLSNFLTNDKLWIGDCFEPKCHDNYKAWQNRIESLRYLFKTDCDYLVDTFDLDVEDAAVQQHKFDDLFSITDGQYPRIYRELLSNNICLETFIILNSILNFIPKFNKQIKETIAWPHFVFKMKKYQAFLEFNPTSYKKILLQTLDYDNHR